MRFLLLLFVLAASQPVVAPLEAWAGIPGSTSPINVDAQGVALKGYDPVAYFEGGTPAKGNPALFASYGGARYLFATAAHRHSFRKDPRKYVPELGGFCVVGAAYGEKVDIDPSTGKVVNGKLYLNNSRKTLEFFDSNPLETIDKAHDNWPSVKDKAL